MEINSYEDCVKASLRYSYPFVLKKRKFAYDGNGNFVVQNENEIKEGIEKLGGKELYAEKWVPFVKEIAIMIARTKNGIITYPVVETMQQNNICHVVIIPAQISESSYKEAIAVATSAVNSLSGYGIFGVEMFQLIDDSILLNEIAPRYIILFYKINSFIISLMKS
jgi:phosphoribosylaminoimidazole carboxylase (NCAIR synthetase)